MAVQTQDIRRDVADPTPNNYIAPGVENKAGAIAAEGIFKVGMEYDAGKRQAKLGDEVNQITNDYLTHSPVVQAQVKPLADTLAKAQDAKDQGRMSFFEFQSRVDRSVREAIAKRPGLAQEFRAIGAQYAGGPAVEYLMKAEAAADEASKSGADKAAQRQYEEDQKVLKDMRDHGLDGDLSSEANPTHEQITGQYKLVGGTIQAMTQNSVAHAALVDKKNAEVAGEYFSEGERVENFGVVANEVQTKAIQGISDLSVKLLKPDQTPGELSSGLLEASSMVDQIIGQIQSYGTINHIPQEVIDSRTSMYKNFKDELKNFPKFDLQQKQALLENVKVSAIIAYRGSSPAAGAMATISDTLGPAAIPAVIAMQPKGVTAAAFATATADALTGQVSDPTTGVVVSSSILQTQVNLAIPSVPGGPPLSQAAQDKLGTTVSAASRNFYLVGDKAFAKVGGIQAWGARGAGYIDQLALNAKNIATHISVSDRGTVANETAKAANNVARVAMQGLVNSNPSLQGVLMIKWGDDGQVIRYNGNREGGDLTSAEKVAIARYNVLINSTSVYKAIDEIGGFKGDNERITKLMSAAYPNAVKFNAEYQASRTPRKALPQPIDENSPPDKTNLKVGDIVYGKKYKGGDPGSEGSWE